MNLKHKTKHRSKKSKRSKKIMKKHGGDGHGHDEHKLTSDPDEHRGHDTYDIPKEVLEEASRAASKVIHEYLLKHDRHEVNGAFAPLLIPLAMSFGPAALSAARTYGPGLMSKFGPGMLKKAEELFNKKTQEIMDKK
jgi:hypothetical protein